MNAFGLLAGQAAAANAPKPYLGFSNLPIGNHEIVEFRLVKNKLYSPTSQKPTSELVLLVELKDQVLFMPHYIGLRLNYDQDKVNELNSDGIKKFLFFGGKAPNSRSYIIDFKSEVQLDEEQRQAELDVESQHKLPLHIYNRY